MIDGLSKRARLSLVLIFSLVFLQMPVVQAAGDATISTCDELQDMADALSTSYTLLNDIDCSVATSEGGSLYNDGAGFNPVGDNVTPFTGTLDGDGYSITGLYINRPAETYVGIFGYLAEGSTVSNLIISDADITGGDLTGGLVGISFSTVTNISFSGLVTGEYGVGGLAGEAAGPVRRSTSSGTITCSDTYCGGLVGFNFTTISDSYSRATVNGTTFVGGLLGFNAAADAEVLRSYSTGVASGNVNSKGGLVGVNEDGEFGVATVTDSFYDTDTSGLSDTDRGTPKTTAEMKAVATFTDTDTDGLVAAWDFVDNPNDDVADNDYWDIDVDVNDGYPFLAWQTITAPTDFTVTVTGTTTIDMSWTDVADNDGYKVDVGAGSDESVFPTVDEYTSEVPNLIAIDWTALTANTQYMARIGAYDSVGTRYTASEPFYTFASVPTNLLTTSTTNNSVSFSWTGDGTSYIVYNSVLGTTSTENTSLSLSDLSCNTAYTFKVKALNGDDVETAYSSDLIITTSSCASSSGGGFFLIPSHSPSQSNTESTENSASYVCKFLDIEGHFAYEAIMELCHDGIVQGRSSILFVPNGGLTRAEALKIVLLATKTPLITDFSNLSAYTDVNSSEWYATYLATATQLSIVEGFDDGTFRPSDTVTRAEMVKILLSVIGGQLKSPKPTPFVDVSSGDWFENVVANAYILGLIKGRDLTHFFPNDIIMRGEAAVIVSRALGITGM